MRKKILAVLMGLIMSTMLVSPALAAELSTGEQDVINDFKTELNYWKEHAGLDDDHINQYVTEAEGALTAIDLPEAGCQEFSEAIKQIHDLCLKANNGAGCKTRAELYGQVDEMLNILNTIGKKYNNLHVSVNATTKYATATWDDPSTGKTTTVATTSKVVKQTGFGVAQTAGVVVAAAATLGIAFVVARKKQLFVA